MNKPRIDGIQKNLKILSEFAALPEDEFEKPEIIERVHHNLRLALEGVFNITSHILARIPGARETEYKKMARKLGECGIVDKDYADNILVQMAGYRNRLTHFYAEVKSKELREICVDQLSDIEKFLNFVGRLLKNPGKFDLALIMY